MVSRSSTVRSCGLKHNIFKCSIMTVTPCYKTNTSETNIFTYGGNKVKYNYQPSTCTSYNCMLHTHVQIPNLQIATNWHQNLLLLNQLNLLKFTPFSKKICNIITGIWWWLLLHSCNTGELKHTQFMNCTEYDLKQTKIVHIKLHIVFLHRCNKKLKCLHTVF